MIYKNLIIYLQNITAAENQIHIEQMKHNLILSLSVLLLMAATVHARQTDSLNLNQQRLYLGVAAGMPMAEADFSSFGADGFRPGWNLGINAGYRFSKVWSLEMTANWGQIFLAE